MVAISGIKCPYCHATFIGKVVKHGLIKCGKCGKTMRL